MSTPEGWPLFSQGWILCANIETSRGARHSLLPPPSISQGTLPTTRLSLTTVLPPPPCSLALLESPLLAPCWWDSPSSDRRTTPVLVLWRTIWWWCQHWWMAYCRGDCDLYFENCLWNEKTWPFRNKMYATKSLFMTRPTPEFLFNKIKNHKILLVPKSFASNSSADI